MSLRYKGGIISATPPTVSAVSATGVWSLEQQMQYQAASTWPLSPQPDPYFENVVALMHFDGTNGGQNNTFLDSSTNAFTITRNGNPTQGSFSPFSRADGGFSNYFDGTGDYLTVSNNTALGMGTGDFTVEFWLYQTAFSNYRQILDVLDGNSAGRLILWVGSTGEIINLGSSGVARHSSAAGAVVANAWTHIALVRSSGVTKFYSNGVQSGSSYTDGNNYTCTTGSVFIGINSDGSSYPYQGYISNFRMVKGTAVYTGAFTPPTTPLTAIANTSLLTCQSNRFKDNSTNNFTITRNGDTSVQVFNPFNPTAGYTTAGAGGSGYFDGTGDYLTYSTPSASVIDWSATGDFTVEAWIYPTTLSGWYYDGGGSAFIPTLVGNNAANSTSNYWSFGPINTGAVRLYYYNGAAVYSTTSTETVKLNQWNHIAFVKTGSNIFYFVNGVGSTAVAISGTPQNSNTVPLTVGSGNNTAISGYVSGLRIVDGTAVYSGSTYTVPTAPPTAITNTSLLLNFTNASSFDSAAMDDYESVGTSQLSTAQFKFGTSSLALNGTTSNYQNTLRSAVLSPNFQLGAGAFTIEGFLRLTGSTAYPYIWTLVRGDGVNAITMFFGDAGYSYNLLIYYNNNLINVGNAASRQSAFLNTWKHFAFVRDSASTFTVYVDGVSVYTTTLSTDFNVPCRLYFGNYGDSSTFGYLDEFRITKGVARYTANFTPPTLAFPNF